MEGHSRNEPWSPRHTHFFQDVLEKQKSAIIKKLTSKLEGFIAFTNLDFLEENNQSLVKQYLIARYLTAESCTSQIFWLFGHEAPELGGELCTCFDVVLCC